MKWVLVHHNNEELGERWHHYFTDMADVEIIRGDICQIPCDAIVSPANSFGFMDGGLDIALSEHFGWDLQDRLQQVIRKRPLRELLVGEAVLVPTQNAQVPWLISAPTMRVPMKLRQSINPYLAMKAVIALVTSHDATPTIERVAVPGLGTGVGGLDVDTSARQMAQAFRELVPGEVTYPADFDEAQKMHIRLNTEIQIWD